MTIKRIKIQNLLSFGPKGIDLELKPLNVLIGPNGCGKSNLLAAISLFQAAPTDIGKPIKQSDGIKNWLWKRDTTVNMILELMLSARGKEEFVHNITIGSEDDVFTIIDEKVKKINNNTIMSRINSNDKFFVKHLVNDFEKGILKDKSLLCNSPLSVNVDFIDKGENATSIKSTVKGNDRLISILSLREISSIYNNISIYRDYRFGVKNTLRFPQNIDRNNKIINDDLSNLFSILHNLKNDETYDRVKSYLSDFNQGYTGYVVVKDEDDLFRFYMLENDERVPISRLSEGTIRYLCLIAILCNKSKPSLCCIEEPELGMHPDLIPTIGRMINEYKDDNSKLIVTTHSDSLINSFEPEDIVVCEKHEGETTMERLEADRLKPWLEKYSLGNLWASGDLGGNRW